MKLIVPEDLQLRPFQKQMVAAQLDNDSPYIYDCSEMGLGKTVMAAAYTNTLIQNARGKKILIVPPASLALNWQEEMNKWLSPHIGFHIVPYSMLTARSHLIQEILREKWELIIFDEFHYCKSLDAQRTLAAFSLWRADPTYGIRMASGTPLPRACATEIFPVVQMVSHLLPGVSQATRDACKDVDVFGKRFAYRYIDRGTVKYRGINKRTVEELANIIYKELKLFYVMTQEEAKIDLPPLHYQVFPLDLDPKLALTPSHVREFLYYFNKFDDNEKWKRATATVRRKLGLAKVASKHMHEHLISFLEAGYPIVIMCAHTEVRHYLANVLKKWRIVHYSGEENNKEKDRAKKMFQNGEADVFLGNIDAAGIGITLTRSQYIFFPEISWNPGPVDQAVKRIMRMTQDKPCTATFYTTNHEFDRGMMQRMIEKLKTMQRLI